MAERGKAAAGWLSTEQGGVRSKELRNKARWHKSCVLKTFPFGQNRHCKGTVSARGF